MARFTIPPNCYSVKTESDGTVYFPNSRGTIEVTNRRHIAEIKRSAEKKELDLIKDTSYALNANAEDRFCPKCTFNCVSWITHCTRCGTKLE